MAPAKKKKGSLPPGLANDTSTETDTASAPNRAAWWSVTCGRSIARNTALARNDIASMRRADDNRTTKKSRWTALINGETGTENDKDQDQGPPKTICPGLVEALAKDLAAMKAKKTTPGPSALAIIAALDKDEELRKWLESSGQVAPGTFLGKKSIADEWPKDTIEKQEGDSQAVTLNQNATRPATSNVNLEGVSKSISGVSVPEIEMKSLPPVPPSTSKLAAGMAPKPLSSALPSASRSSAASISSFKAPIVAVANNKSANVSIPSSRQVEEVKETNSVVSLRVPAQAASTSRIASTQITDSVSDNGRAMPGLYTASEIVVVLIGVETSQRRLFIHKDLLTRASKSIVSKLKISKNGSNEVPSLSLPYTEYHIFVGIVDYLYQERVTLYPESSPRKGPTDADDLLHAWILANDLGMEDAQNAFMNSFSTFIANQRLNSNQVSSQKSLSTIFSGLLRRAQSQTSPLLRGSPPYKFLVDQMLYDLLAEFTQSSGSKVTELAKALESAVQLRLCTIDDTDPSTKTSSKAIVTTQRASRVDDGEKSTGEAAETSQMQGVVTTTDSLSELSRSAFSQSNVSLPFTDLGIHWWQCSGTGAYVFEPRDGMDVDETKKVRYQTITQSTLFDQYSLEELRLADYAANRKSRFSFPVALPKSGLTSGLKFVFRSDPMQGSIPAGASTSRRIGNEDEEEEL